MSIFAAMIDFIHTLLFGFDYPGLVKALDPITIGLLVGQGVQQAGKMIEANQQKKAAEEQMRQGKDMFDKMVSEFESGKYDVSLSQDVRDTAEQQRILAEQVADQAAQRGTASIQSALAATRYGDPRSGALIPGQLQKVEAGIQQAELAGLQQKVSADAAVASAQQRIDEQNKELQQSLGAMKLSRGAAGMDAGQLAAQQAQAAKIAAATGLASTVGQGLAMGVAGGGGGAKTGTGTGTGTAAEVPGVRFAAQNPTNPALFNETPASRAATLGSVAPVETVDPSSGASVMDRIALGEYLGTQEGRSMPAIPLWQQALNTAAGTSPYDMGPANYQKGGQYEFANSGSEVHMTEGEFSHKTNKKALIDEETGEKEAELTGDEAMVMDGENMLVFNPKQQGTIEALVNKGDANALMKKMKALLKKFNKENV
jgi:hypothetical protein